MHTLVNWRQNHLNAKKDPQQCMPSETTWNASYMPLWLAHWILQDMALWTKLTNPAFTICSIFHQLSWRICRGSLGSVCWGLWRSSHGNWKYVLYAFRGLLGLILICFCMWMLVRWCVSYLLAHLSKTGLWSEIWSSSSLSLYPVEWFWSVNNQYLSF